MAGSTSPGSRSTTRSGVAISLGLAVLATSFVATSQASANPAGTGLVISEAYGGGGNAGATWKNDFVELHNPTGAAISVAGMSIQYRSSASSSAASNVTTLTGSVPAGGHYLVSQSAGAGGTDDLPAPDATGTASMSGSAFQVWLAAGATALTPPVGDVAGTAGIIDFVGVNAGSFETMKTAGTANATSVSRNTVGGDTDVNSADLTVGVPTPQSSGGGNPDPEPEPEPEEPADATIAEIQGTGAASPLAGDLVTTRGVVTATYPTGGYNGFYLQTEGTGGAVDATPGASDGLFVYGRNVDESTLALGDLVEVTGPVSEFAGTTQVTPAAAADVVGLAEVVAPVSPLATALPPTEEDREAHEGELLAPTGPFTVTNTYSTNQYAEIGLAAGDTPLVQPTDVADAQDTAAIAAITADNAARGIVLDDGASINFLPFGGGANMNIPLPYLTRESPIRVGAPVTFTQPVVLEYRNSAWKFQPTTQLTAAGTAPATFVNTRTAAPEEVGGDLKLATFNVLNYFNTTGQDYEAAHPGSCDYYADRAGTPIGVDDCGPTGPRGAATTVSFERQQSKIVKAINALDAGIVSLEEIENSVALGESDRDDALAALVTALNADAGAGTWAFAASPTAENLPPLAGQDVIRTAFIYQPAVAAPVGESQVLVGSGAFANAREPLAQAFKPAGSADADAFAVIVNHFKSKGSGVNDGTGQGNANPDRVAQAEALAVFADEFAASRGTEKVFLTGDFNSYTQEDPMQVLYGRGFTSLKSDTAGETTYSFGGLSGSLDHVLANAAALEMVTGVDIWNINSGESVAFEYSRYNYNATDFFVDDVFRSSDHDPEIVGLDVAGDQAEQGPATLQVEATPKRVTAGRTRVRLHITVTAEEARPTGQVTVEVPGQGVLTGTLRNGRVTLRLGAFAHAGTKQVVVTYLGDESVAGATRTIEIEVRKKAGAGGR